jgi:hypothetical protein
MTAAGRAEGETAPTGGGEGLLAWAEASGRRAAQRAGAGRYVGIGDAAKTITLKAS